MITHQAILSFGSTLTLHQMPHGLGFQIVTMCSEAIQLCFCEARGKVSTADVLQILQSSAQTGHMSIKFDSLENDLLE